MQEDVVLILQTKKIDPEALVPKLALTSLGFPFLGLIGPTYQERVLGLSSHNGETFFMASL